MHLNIKEMQNIVSDMLKETIKVCEKNNITYYAQAGTVLGTVRHQGPIPWDHDSDIIVPNNEIMKFVECLARDLPEKYYVDYYKNGNKTLLQFPRIGLRGYSTNVLHIDVFRLIGLPNNRDEQLKIINEANELTQNIKLMRKPLWKLVLKGKLHAVKTKIIDRLYYINKFDELCNRYNYDEATYVMNPSGRYKEKNIFLKEVYGKGKTLKYLDFNIKVPSETDFYLKQYYNDYMKFPPKDETDIEMRKVFNVK